MTKKDLNYIAAVEKAIAGKYGKETIQNPKNNWDEIKEKEYDQQIKELAEKERKRNEADEKVNVNGVLVTKRKNYLIKSPAVPAQFVKSICLVQKMIFVSSNMIAAINAT